MIEKHKLLDAFLDFSYSLKDGYSDEIFMKLQDHAFKIANSEACCEYIANNYSTFSHIQKTHLLFFLDGATLSACISFVVKDLNEATIKGDDLLSAVCCGALLRHIKYELNTVAKRITQDHVAEIIRSNTSHLVIDIFEEVSELAKLCSDTDIFNDCRL